MNNSKITKLCPKIKGAHQGFDILKPDRVPFESFPDKAINGYPTKTVGNVRLMLEFYGISVTYNTLKKDIYIDIPGMKSCSDIWQNNTFTQLASLASLNGIYSNNFERYVAVIAGENPVNPILDWITDTPWDSIDRLPKFYGTVVAKDTFPEELKETLLLRWLIGAVAALTEPNGISMRGVITLQSAQGAGKTRWVSNLINDEKLKSDYILLDHHLDGNNKDSTLNAIRHWIVEVGELDSSFKRDVAKLKGFITNSRDKIRQPYDKRESEFARRSVFIATVNDNNFLVDTTGNTRWWTIPCVKLNHDHPVNMQQVFSQIFEMRKTSPEYHRWWLNKEEEQELERHNSAHQAVNAVTEMLLEHYAFDAEEDATGWHSSSAIDALRRIGIDAPTNAQCRDAGNFFRSKLGEPKRSKGYSVWKIPPAKEDYERYLKLYGEADPKAKRYL